MVPCNTKRTLIFIHKWVPITLYTTFYLVQVVNGPKGKVIKSEVEKQVKCKISEKEKI